MKTREPVRERQARVVPDSQARQDAGAVSMPDFRVQAQMHQHLSAFVEQSAQVQQQHALQHSLDTVHAFSPPVAQLLDIDDPGDVVTLQQNLTRLAEMSGIGTGLVGAFTRRVAGLTPLQRTRVRNALRGLGTYFDQHRDDFDNADQMGVGQSNAKIAIGLTGLLYKILSGQLDVDDVGFGDDVEFAYEDIIYNALDSEQSTDDVAGTLANDIGSTELNYLENTINEISVNAPVSGLFELIQKRYIALMVAKNFAELRELHTVLERVGAQIPANSPVRDDAEGKKKIDLFKASLLASWATEQKTLDELRHMDVPDQAIQSDQVSSDQVASGARGMFDEISRKGYEQAKAHHRLDRGALKILIEGWAESSNNLLLKNSCEWLKKKRTVAYAITPTHDAVGRAEAAGRDGFIAYFPDPASGAGDVFSASTVYSLANNSNITFKRPSTLGAANAEQGTIVIPNAKRAIDQAAERNKIARTIVHEVQHVADLHEATPLGRYQSEFNAYSLGHGVKGGYDFLTDKDEETGVDAKGKHWNEKQYAIFEHLDSANSYQYLSQGWRENQDGFRDKVVAINKVYSPNPINSVRIDEFNRILKTVNNPGDFMAGNFEDKDKEQALYSAFTQLKYEDLRALRGNKATEDLLKKHLISFPLVDYLRRFGFA